MIGVALAWVSPRILRMTATLESGRQLTLSEDVFAQGRLTSGMQFQVSLTPSGALILRPAHARQKSLVEHLRGLQGLELTPNREPLGPPIDL